MPDLVHQGIAGIGAGALVVKGLLDHRVEPVEEVRLVNAIVADRLFDADLFLERVDRGDQTFQLFRIGVAAELEVVGDLRITSKRMRMVILRESPHLDRDLGGVEAQNLIDHQSVGYAVGQMVKCPEFVRHGVAYAKKRISKGHTGHAGGVRHIFPRARIAGTVGVGSGQVFKNQLQTAEGETVGVVRCHDGSVGLECVGHRVDAGSGSQTFGGVHHQIGIHDRHLRQQFIVRQRIFHARDLICDDSKRRDFGTGAGGGGNRDKIGALPHLREGVDALSNVAEAHRHVLKIYVGMFVEDPHDLSCVHCRSAAYRKDEIRPERRHLCCALFGTCQRGVGCNVIECRMRDTHFVELLLDRLRIAVLIEERVCDDERSFVMFQLVERDRQAALFEIGLFRCAKPKHILPPDRDGFDVQQLVNAHVLRHRVAAPASAAEGQRRRQLEIIQIANAAL